MSLGLSDEGRRQLSAVLDAAGGGAVRLEDAQKALGADRRTASEKLGRWARHGWLRRVTRGLFIPVPVHVSRPQDWSANPLYLAHLVWTPCYFTGWTAASHWGLTEQLFRTTVLKTTHRVRRREQRLLEHDYLVSHVADEHLWGLRVIWVEELRLRVADPARTIVDVLDAPGIGGGIRHVAEMLEAYLDDHEPERLVEYADRLGNRTVFKRLGYLLSLLAPHRDVLLETCQNRVSEGISLLDPSAPRRGRRVMEWNLRINVTVGDG